MPSYRSDPDRRSLPVADWPSEDRGLLDRACRAGGLFDDAGAALRWAPATLRRCRWAYGRWLTHLHHHAPETLCLPPTDRLTTERLAKFVARLETQVSPRAVHGYVQALRMLLVVMNPAADWSWLRRPIARLHLRAGRSRITEHDLLPVDRLLRGGIRAMREAETDAGPSALYTAVRYRDGLMVALNAAAALRRRNLAAIRIGRNLVARGDCYILIFEADEMKTRRRHEIPLPALLTPFIEGYLTLHRPLLLQGATHDALWVSQYRAPLAMNGIGQRFPKLTKRMTGKRLTSHRVRHCLASSIVNCDPAHARNAVSLLGHVSYATSETFYVRGNMLLASRAQGSLIAARRAGACHDVVNDKRHGKRK
jgi:integrase/recombinase XerD